jgi:hypothetical protein
MFLDSGVRRNDGKRRALLFGGECMHVIPAVVLLSASVALGLFLGLQYLRRVRSKQVLIAVHLMLGGAGLEGMAVLLRGTPDGTVLAAGVMGNTAAVLLATAMITGLATPMIAKRNPRKVGSVALATHAGIAAGGFVLFLAWVLQL